MKREEYKQKLQEFNGTEKYKREQEFLIKLLQPQRGERILDYGTGLGRMVYHLNDTFGTSCYGYDFINLREKDCQFWFRTEYHFKFHKVFFMHSIAHVPEIKDKLIYLRENMLEPDGKVYVITPNGEWVIHQDNQVAGYKPDPTIIQHFYLTDLENVFTEAGFKINISGQFGAVTNSNGDQYINERLFLEATI